jgi:hypothetical protein
MGKEARPPVAFHSARFSVAPRGARVCPPSDNGPQTTRRGAAALDIVESLLDEPQHQPKTAFVNM